MEPAAFGLPIIMGPFTSTVHDIVESLKKQGGLVQVLDEQQLSSQIVTWLLNEENARKAGRASKDVWSSNYGASERLAKKVISLISELDKRRAVG